MKRLILLSGLLFLNYSVLAENQRKYSTEDYIDTWKITAIEQMNEFQIPASITLAQGILESGNGNSALAVTANNHFGIKCHKEWDGERFFQDDDVKNECFRSYSHAAQSYEDHSVFLTTRSRYAGLFELEVTDYKGWAKGLKAAGYATNPKYASLLIEIIEKHDLAKYDNMPYLPSQQKGDLHVNIEEPLTKVDPPKDIKEENLVQLEIDARKHEVKVNKYRTRYVIVHKGDTYYQIAKEFELGMWQLYKYNDLGKRDVLKEGEIIYLDPKRNKSKRGNNVFVCDAPVTLRDISQTEGIKLKKLLKYNFGNTADETLPKGTKVILR
ncbi:MAG: glucosaminidase domain-containing protein [Crocinitomicaceae bacterium]|nr:glucosaminidase domain-containing protein [Crocinitomicaceae bacterium]